MSSHRTKVLALVLAGGSGTRLGALTTWRCKPALPFGAQFRTIDFALSNCINSGVRQIALLTQYKAQSLIRHVQAGWSFLHRELGEYVDIWPAQQRLGERWYLGNVDAVHQNLELIAAADPELVLILSGTEIYAMDYQLMVEVHAARGLPVTVGVAHGAGGDRLQTLVTVERGARVRGLSVGDEDGTRPRSTLRTLMGVYLFDAGYLFDRVAADAADADSLHDFAIDVLPAAIARGHVAAYDLVDPRTGVPGYWRNLSTVDAYWQAHMDLLDEPPKFDVFAADWPIWTHQAPSGPARVHGGRLNAALLGPGCSIAGEVNRSVIGAKCRIGAHSLVTNSVLLPDVQIGSGCSLDQVVVDRGCMIPDNTVVGNSTQSDPVHDVTPQGVVVIAQRRGPPARTIDAKVA